MSGQDRSQVDARVIPSLRRRQSHGGTPCSPVDAIRNCFGCAELQKNSSTAETEGVADKVSTGNAGKQPKGKSKSATPAAAREHARELREAKARRDRRRRMLVVVGVPVLVVVLIIVGFVVVKANQS